MNMNTPLVVLVALTVGHLVVAVAVAVANDELESAPSVPTTTTNGSNLLGLLTRVIGAMSAGIGASPHIVGGSEVQPHSHPHQVALLCTSQGGRQSLCGGSLITPRWVLTAAHCTHSMKEIIAILGAHNIGRLEKGRQVIQGQRVVDRGWNAEDKDDDIALLQLRVPAVLNGKVKTIRLPSLSIAQKTLSHTSVVVSGWGRFDDGKQDHSLFLRSTKSSIINNNLCMYMYGLVTSKMLCVDGSRRRGVCNGDSGGPLTMTESDGERTLIGVTSFGSKEGCEAGHPTVFTRVDRYLRWIANYTGIKLRQ